MKETRSYTKFLTKPIIEWCFDVGEHNYVDKQICGNGFSSSFLKLKPRGGRQNIMIAPNKAVVEDKERQYIDGDLVTDNKIVFVYAESKDKKWHGADVVVFVADSFLIDFKNLKYEKMFTRGVEKILLDESHSVEIQSMFRVRLQLLNYQVDNNFLESTAVVSVTATPNKYSKVTHRIINPIPKKMIINYGMNPKESIKRMKDSIKGGHKVLLCTNSSFIISSLKTKGALKANFIVGKSLMSKLTEKMKVIRSSGAQLTVVSSRGFEGYDIFGLGYHVYFFEDRSRGHETFYISNLYQAINRVRDGGEYIEYCCSMMGKERALIKKKRLLKFVNTKVLSPAQKLTKKYKEFNIFISPEYLEDGEIKVHFNSTKYNLEVEKKEYDKGFVEFGGFLKSRNVEVKYLNNVSEHYPQIGTKRESRIDNLANNIDLIREFDLYGDEFILKVERMDSGEHESAKRKYQKKLLRFLDCKNYDGLYIRSDRENIAFKILNETEKETKARIRQLTKAYDEYYIKKLGFKKSKEKRDRFKKSADTFFYMYIQMFVNHRISLPKNIIAHRDYNLISLVNYEITIIVAEWFGVKITEVDIKSCFSRILYALNGEYLPAGFYGEQKENKKKVNMYLNMAWYDMKDRSDEKSQKKNAKRRLKSVNIDEKVIDYVINNFFNKDYKGDLFNFLSFHERIIIKKISHQINEENPDIEGLISRHDSVIIFGEYYDINFLSGFQYLGKYGWFDLSDKKEVDFVDFDEHDHWV